MAAATRMVTGKVNIHAIAIRTNMPRLIPEREPIIVPATPEVMMCVVLTGNPVKPAVAIRPAPTSSADAPCPGVIPAAQRADWYARGVGGAAARVQPSV
jgi:hypothetical protein